MTREEPELLTDIRDCCRASEPGVSEQGSRSNRPFALKGHVASFL